MRQIEKIELKIVYKKTRLLFAAAAVSSLLFFPQNKLGEKERDYGLTGRIDWNKES